MRLFFHPMPHPKHFNKYILYNIHNDIIAQLQGEKNKNDIFIREEEEGHSLSPPLPPPAAYFLFWMAQEKFYATEREIEKDTHR